MTETKIKVLMVEDEPADEATIHAMIVNGGAGRYEVVHEKTLSGATERLRKETFDLILLDLSLPDSNGLTTMNSIQHEASGAAIVVITGTDDEAIALEALKSGAEDFLVKGQFNVSLLVRSAKYAVERKRAEEKIEKAATEWRKTFDSISDMVLILDKERTVVRANKAVFNILGLRPQDILGKKCHQWAHSGDHPWPGCPLEKLLVDKKVYSEEVRGPQGESLWVTVSPILDEQGELQGAVHIAQDITERKKIEGEVVKSRNYLRNIINAVADPIFVKDSNGCWALFNDAFCKFMGRSPGELIGKTEHDYFPKKEADIFLEKDKKVLETGAESINEEIFTDAKGISYVIVTKRALYTDPQGKKMIVGIIRDVTEFKRVEKELQQQRELLEEMVKDRTVELELSNQKLRLTAKDLELAGKAKSEFLSNMSHELRTPLNSIIGFSEVLYDEKFGGLNERQKRYAKNVLTSGRHLLSLINDVLDLSKVESGKMVLEPSLFSAKECIEEALRLVEGLAFDKKIYPAVEIPQDIGEIHADQRKVKQVICNLLSNAIKYTPARGSVGIRVKKNDKGIEIAVWDSGIGIAAENFEKVFEAFARLGDTYTQETEGTGLGLTISKKIIELHGGKMWIESEGTGKGTTVKCTIPPPRGLK